MPEWQGASVGVRFLNVVYEAWWRGRNRYGIQVPTLFHTSHPGLAAARRRDPHWWQIDAQLYGGHKGRSASSIRRSALRVGWDRGGHTGYGGHFRAVQGFRYFGKRPEFPE